MQDIQRKATGAERAAVKVNLASPQLKVAVVISTRPALHV
jgi:hypothetical protein